MGLFGLAMSYTFFFCAHVLQIVLAATVCGLYGYDLGNARSQGKYMDSKWVYAVVVGTLSGFTALFYLFPCILRGAFNWVWSFIIFFLWVVLFGIFGGMYIHADPQGDSGIQRMKNAVWVDLTNALLWLITSIAAVIYWHTHRERDTRFTSRAVV